MTSERTRRGEAGKRSGRALVPASIGGLLAALVVSLVASAPVWAAKPEAPQLEKATGEGVPDQNAQPGAGQGRPPAEASAAGAKAAGAAGAPIVYVPPSRGRARHTAGAGTRGPTQNPPRVAVLAPRDHVGLTTSAHPRLYWHLSETTATRIELTVVDDEATDPLLELSLPGPVAAGVHALDLGALGIALEPNKTYRWFVAVVHDPLRRSRDELAEGAIERVAAPTGAKSAGAAATDRERKASDRRANALAQARAGFWYDALAGLEEALAEDPTDAGLRADRTALLAQGDLAFELP
jgi:hypothetical protein